MSEISPDTLLLGLVWYVVFLFSITFHEAAHALAAYRLGDTTAYEGGQVTLHPWPHMRREPFGTVLVPLLSFAISGWMIGWASAPYDPAWAHRHPRRSALMSLAGPLSNLLLVIAAGIGIRLGMLGGVFGAPDSIDFTHLTAGAPGWDGVATGVSILFTLNLLLFVFNLIPVPPLDGSGVLPLFLSPAAGRRYQELLWGQPMLSLVGLLLAWRLVGYVFPTIQLFAIRLLYPGMGYGF